MQGSLAAPPAAAPGSLELQSEHGFKSELSRWLEPLRQALAQLLREVDSPATPRILQQQLNVPYATCWRVFRIVRATDVTAEARHAPSPGGLKSVISAARKRGLTDATAAAVAAAATQFRSFTKRHAEDRSTFESMVSEQADRQSQTLVVQRRRSAYRALSQLWGVQTDLQCLTTFAGPPAADGGFAKAGLLLQRGVRRLRTDAQVTLMGLQPKPVETQAAAAATLPLDAAAAARHGMPVLPAFSSSPLPQIEAVTMATGWRLYNLIGGDVGLKSNIEFALGFKAAADAPSEFSSDGRPLFFRVSRPTESPSRCW
ncbi:MAG: hypothetical protein QM754_13055 [Tepidisphaeraceae bacterium]